MNRLAAILPLANVLVDVDATSKKRAFEHAGLLFENQPVEGGSTDHTNEDLAKLAREAGANDSTQRCIATGAQVQAAAQAAQQGAAMAQAVDSAKTASEVSPDGLRDVMGMFQGYNSPTPIEAA